MIVIQGSIVQVYLYLSANGLTVDPNYSLNGGAISSLHSGSPVNDTGKGGLYWLTLDSTDTGVLGTMGLTFTDHATALAVVPVYCPEIQIQTAPSGSDPWATVLPGAYPPGQAGYILGHEGAGSDPWATVLPGAYPPGQAGNIVGKNLNAAISAIIYILTRGNPPVV